MKKTADISAGNVISAAEWNRICAQVEKSAMLSAVSPLEIVNQGSGQVLRWVDPNEWTIVSEDDDFDITPGDGNTLFEVHVSTDDVSISFETLSHYRLGMMIAIRCFNADPSLKVVLHTTVDSLNPFEISRSGSTLFLIMTTYGWTVLGRNLPCTTRGDTIYFDGVDYYSLPIGTHEVGEVVAWNYYANNPISGLPAWTGEYNSTPTTWLAVHHLGIYDPSGTVTLPAISSVGVGYTLRFILGGQTGGNRFKTTGSDIVLNGPSTQSPSDFILAGGFNGVVTFFVLSPITWYVMHYPANMPGHLGDIMVSTTKGWYNFPVSPGTNGCVLTLDSGQPLGVKWAPTSTTGFTGTL